MALDLATTIGGAWVLYAALGGLAGLLAGLLGIGGGLVIVPALAWLFRQQGIAESVVMHLAIGSSLATIVITSLASVRAHHQRDAVAWPVVGGLVPGILLGALAGALTAGLISTVWLQRLFALFAIAVGLRMMRRATPRGHRNLPDLPQRWVAGSVIGWVSAMVGIGGGSLTVPYLVWHRMPVIRAVGTSSACGLPLALAGALGFLIMGWRSDHLPSHATGYLYWPAVLGIVLASVPAATLGARLAHRLPVAVLARVFALLLMVVGLDLLFSGVVRDAP